MTNRRQGWLLGTFWRGDSRRRKASLTCRGRKRWATFAPLPAVVEVHSSNEAELGKRCYLVTLNDRDAQSSHPSHETPTCTVNPGPRFDGPGCCRRCWGTEGRPLSGSPLDTSPSPGRTSSPPRPARPSFKVNKMARTKRVSGYSLVPQGLHVSGIVVSVFLPVEQRLNRPFIGSCPVVVAACSLCSPSVLAK